MQKRSLTLAGHKTSLALEKQFWEALDQIARESDTTLPLLIGRIDAARQTQNLSSAVRVFVLAHFRENAMNPSPSGTGEPLKALPRNGSIKSR